MHFFSLQLLPCRYFFIVVFLGPIYVIMIFRRAILAVALAASSAMAHSNMFSPIPRKDVSSAFVSRDNNACEDTGTVIPDANNFQRGQTIPLKCE